MVVTLDVEHFCSHTFLPSAALLAAGLFLAEAGLAPFPPALGVPFSSFFPSEVLSSVSLSALDTSPDSPVASSFLVSSVSPSSGFSEEE